MAINDPIFWLFGASFIAILALWIGWSGIYGPARGGLAAASRALWIAPIFLAFFPQTTSRELPRSMQMKPIHVLIDDSESMDSAGPSGDRFSDSIEGKIKELEKQCLRLGCLPKISYLSKLDSSVAKGFTPLNNVLQSWLYKVGLDPWVVMSDGGDSQPARPWSQELAGMGKIAKSGVFPASGNSRGLIVGFKGVEPENVWLEEIDASPFSFEGKPVLTNVVVHRSKTKNSEERIQIQALLNGKALATSNAEFDQGEEVTSVVIAIPPLQRGQHLISIKALPTAGERVLWDNEVHFNIEVMPNTVGVLHLLGSPSWDGRFLRRYLKAEPKYDLISFFILRDPWDSQQVNERELSLIPFPVERLFKEELPNFRVVVLQNFTLLQFLQPEYQRNLVKFVKEGGGLLFLGGERALQDVDLRNSPLREILPFQVSNSDSGMLGGTQLPFSSIQGNKRVNKSGPWYDPKLKYSIKLAQPESHQRTLANVYDDWESLGHSLEAFGGMKGLHHMENVEFKTEDHTPLLKAVTPDGKEIPLAVASYPGKGRAIWLFTDSFNKLAMTMNKNIPRQTYHKFMQSSMTWLLRQDLNKPLVTKNFDVLTRRGELPSWKATIRGPAVRYYQPSKDWQIQVCGEVVEQAKLSIKKTGPDEITFLGKLSSDVAGVERCRFDISGVNSAFGSLKASYVTSVPKVYSDREIGDAPNKLRLLSTLTGATLVKGNRSGFSSKALDWLETIITNDGISLPNRFKTIRNFYWILESWLIWVLMLFLPIEIIIRRWDKLAASSGKAYRRAWRKKKPAVSR